MRKIHLFSLFIALSFLFHSCIDLGLYISDLPLGYSKTYPTDIALTGKWKKVNGGEEETGIDTLEFILFNKNEYVIRSVDGGDKSLIRAFITKISGESFLNMQELSGTERKYVFCKYKINGKKELELYFLSDSLFGNKEFKSRKKLRKFVKKNLKDPELFSKEMNFSLQRSPDTYQQ